jgi:hypothetical protein
MFLNLYLDLGALVLVLSEMSLEVQGPAPLRQ